MLRFTRELQIHPENFTIRSPLLFWEKISQKTKQNKKKSISKHNERQTGKLNRKQLKILVRNNCYYFCNFFNILLSWVSHYILMKLHLLYVLTKDLFIHLGFALKLIILAIRQMKKAISLKDSHATCLYDFVLM